MGNTDISGKRVTISEEAWKAIDVLLSELPFRVAAPVVSTIQRTGGVPHIDQQKE